MDEHLRDCCLVAALENIQEHERGLSRILWTSSPDDRHTAERARDALNPLGTHIAETLGMTRAFADMHDGRSRVRKDLPPGKLWCEECRKRTNEPLVSRQEVQG